MPNFSPLAGLEVAEKFVWGVGGGVGGGVGWFAQSFSCQTQPLCCVVLGLGWGFDKNKDYLKYIENTGQVLYKDNS